MCASFDLVFDHKQAMRDRNYLSFTVNMQISSSIFSMILFFSSLRQQVIPAPLLCIFTASELQALFGGGDPHVDDSTLRQWRRACVYETYEGNELASTIATIAAAQENSSSSVSSDVKPTRRAANGFDASHPSARGVWECLARASGTERAAVWRFVTGTDAPPPLLSPRWQKTTAQSISGESLGERRGDSGGGGEDGDSSLFTLALCGPLTASEEADNSSGTNNSDFSKSGNSGNIGTGSSNGPGNGVGNVTRSSDVTRGRSSTKGKLFTASTCVQTLYVPHEPFESLAEVAASLAESVALGLHPNLVNNDQASSNGEAAAGENDDFTEAQRRLRAAVSSAALRIANGAAAGSGGNTGGSAAAGSVAVDPLTMRSLFPNSYQCPRCGCGPIDHAACDDLKTHHGERRAGAKVSNACPACGWFSSELADWLPWDGTLE